MASKAALRAPHQELKEAIGSGRLSGPIQKRALAILERIERPVRLGFLGLPQSGKSSLLNLLIGAEVIPATGRLPTISLTYGDAPEVICTLADGTRETLDGGHLGAAVELKPAFVEAKLPLPALKKLSMLEVVAGANPVEQQRAIQWASKRIDLALWCCETTFGTDEQALWQYAPEKIQDHSFLMLTKVDMPAARLRLDDRLAQAKSNARDDFKTILPIGTKAALAARQTNGVVDKEAMRNAGGMALISTLLREVETGQEFAIDEADVFLRQIDFSATRKETAAREAEAEASAPVPAPEPVAAEPVAPEPVAPEPVAAPEPEEAPIVASEPVVIPLSEAARVVMEQAVEQLISEGDVMVSNLNAGALDKRIKGWKV